MAFTKRGLRLVEALGRYSKQNPTYFDTQNIFSKIKFTAANDEHLKAIMTVDSGMCNGYKIMHGGCIALVVDVMCLYAHVVKTNGRMAYTSNMNINFIGTAIVGEKLIAKAITVKGGNSSIMESILYKENGGLIAKGIACFRNGNEQSQRQAADIIDFDVFVTDE